MKYIWFSDNKSAWFDYTGNKIFEYKVRLFQNNNHYLILDTMKKNIVILINKENGRLWDEKDEYPIKDKKYLVCSEIKESDLPKCSLMINLPPFFNAYLTCENNLSTSSI